MTTLDYARIYAARGWSVVPLIAGTKRPAVELRPFLAGERRATEADFFQWWSAPHGDGSVGIGIICGQPSGGLVVIDVDPRNGGDLSLATEMADAPQVATGGGGLHVYCQADGLCPKGKAGRPGVDRQGDGGYVVAPPTALGTGYRWVTGVNADPVPLPAWAIDRPQWTVVSGSGEPWVAAALDPRSVAPGTQEETLTRLSWWAAGSLDRDLAEVILWQWAQGLTLGNSANPWTLSHVRQKLDAAYAKRDQVFVVESAPASGAPAAAAPPPQPDPVVPASAFVPLRSLEFPDQEWVVADFVAPGAFTEVIGKVKKGKSTLVYQLVRSVLTGEPFLGRAVSPGPVVVLTEQEGSSLKATLTRARLYGTDLPLVVVRKSGLAALGPWPVAAGRVVDLAAWLGARVLVVDTLARLARLHGDAENSSGAVAVLDPFDRARALGMACVFVRHARKGVAGGDDDIADAARGSSAITGDMDIVIRHRPSGSSDDTRVLSWESRLTDDPEDVALRYVDGFYEVTDLPDSASAVDRREKIEAMRRALDGGARTYAELKKATGWGSDHTVKKYKAIVEAGESLPVAQDNGGVK